VEDFFVCAETISLFRGDPKPTVSSSRRRTRCFLHFFLSAVGAPRFPRARNFSSYSEAQNPSRFISRRPAIALALCKSPEMSDVVMSPRNRGTRLPPAPLENQIRACASTVQMHFNHKYSFCIDFFQRRKALIM
jgi:hypothetical protein